MSRTRPKLTVVEPDNAWLDELAQLEPIARGEVEAAKKAVKERADESDSDKQAGRAGSRQQ